MAVNIGLSLIIFKKSLEMVTFCSQTSITSKRHVLLKVKVKQSHYRPGQALRVPGG
jgi:hypothetical protein